MDNIDLLRKREAIMAQKLEKQRHLIELVSSQHEPPSTPSSLSKSGGSGKKRSRTKSNQADDFEFTKQLKLTSPYAKPNIPALEPVVTYKNVTMEESQLEELRKEHKNNRKLVKEQFKEYHTFNQHTTARVDELQLNINLIMEHFGIPPPQKTGNEELTQNEKKEKTLDSDRS
jgi:hypothetical protein